MTGGRVFRASKYLSEDNEDFFLTYGDAVADIDLNELYRLHKSENKEITVTAVHPSGRFGEMRIDGNNVIGFHEKPQTEKGLINGGFMVLKKSFVERYLYDDSSFVLEQKPMNTATRDNQMSAYVHDGFWQCMDTQREHLLLNNLWEAKEAPWKIW